jgi:5S rRNA maturation endonuclease (ribonuclease M5)
MIRGFLSRLKYKWNKVGDKEATFNETVDFLLKFLNQDYGKLVEENVDLEKIKFATNVKLFDRYKLNNNKKTGLSRESVRSKLHIPSEYHKKRGYGEKILDRYDVGLCMDSNKPMFQRSVVPIYDEDSNYVGCTGRSIFEKCTDCGYYHNPEINCHPSHKWIHSKGFLKSNHLYNFNNAKQFIKESHIAVVVESPGNVWRLEEAGIHNSVAIFGSSMNIEQKILLDQSGAMSLIVIMDNDDGGKLGIRQIKELCERTYRLYFPTFNENDLGDMSVDRITDDIKPFIDNLMESYNAFRI